MTVQQLGTSVFNKKLFSVFVLALFLFGCSSQQKQVEVPPEPEKIKEPPVEIEPSMLDKIRELYGEVVAGRVEYWQEMIAGASERTELENLRLVNNFFNGARFVDDQVVWSQNDYWATPLEFLIMDAGDCEDFSTSKYFTLKKMGLDTSKMRLTHCKAKSLNQAHMVLSYYPEKNAEPLILDNIDERIVPASKRLDLVPVFSFNGKDLWLSRSRTHEVRSGTPDNLKRWQDWQTRSQSDEVPVLVIRDFAQ